MSIIHLFLLLQLLLFSECYGKKGGCGGDRNAVLVNCPSPCPRTCGLPYHRPCEKKCARRGCQCKRPFILSKINGRCVLPDHCPARPLCPQNETFVSCKVGCPTNYCSSSHLRSTIICDPPHPCPSGCVCKQNYKRLSYNDRRCVHISECPRPIKSAMEHD